MKRVLQSVNLCNPAIRGFKKALRMCTLIADSALGTRWDFALAQKPWLRHPILTISRPCSLKHFRVERWPPAQLAVFPARKQGMTISLLQIAPTTASSGSVLPKPHRVT
jgi:hypothetical protein